MDQTDTAIRAIIKSLSDTVAPALPEADPLAREQLRLALDYLEFLRLRLPDLHQRERAELRHQIALAKGIAAAGALGNHAEAMTDLCRRAEALAADPGAGTGAIRDMAMDLAFAVAGVVQTLAEQATVTASRIRQTVLDETARKVELERFWYAPIGFEPSPLDQSRLRDLLQ